VAGRRQSLVHVTRTPTPRLPERPIARLAALLTTILLV
jgi:hypothetical protein